MSKRTNEIMPGQGDSVSRRILEILQDDARTSQAEIGRKVGLTASSVNARIKRLEKQGFIRKHVVLVDPDRVGCKLTAFVEVDIEHPKYEKTFLDLVKRLVQVQECHHVTGQYAFLLKVRTRDVASLKEIILDKICALEGIRGTKSLVVLDTAKESTAVSLAHWSEP